MKTKQTSTLFSRSFANRKNRIKNATCQSTNQYRILQRKQAKTHDRISKRKLILLKRFFRSTKQSAINRSSKKNLGPQRSLLDRLLLTFRRRKHLVTFKVFLQSKSIKQKQQRNQSMANKMSYKLCNERLYR